MNPHPRNARIQGSAYQPNRFIFGDAIDEQGLEPTEYVIHTQAPFFVCRLVGNDDTPFAGRDSTQFASEVLFDDTDDITLYVCNSGFRLFDFVFNGPVPTAARLKQVCDEAMETYLRLQTVYEEQEKGFKQRQMRIAEARPLPPAERAEAIARLMQAARDAVGVPLKQMQLPAAVRAALATGDQAVFTESQLALLGEQGARRLLVEAARDAIAFPEVVRKDGSIQSFELWALPFAFSRAEGGVWWHFPMLERAEPVLADALEIPEKAILWLSPTIYTCDMLADRACQDLIQLAPVMDSGCDLAPVDPESSRATFEAASKTRDPQWVLAWIPFLVERGTLPVENVRRLGRKALEAVMPLVQDAVGAEMTYGEAELFAPLPWWDALEAGVYAWNRKRLALTVSVLAAGGGLAGLHARATYQPESQAYEVSLFREGDTRVQARCQWHLVPDVAPERERAWNDLASCMKDAGIELSEQAARLH